MNKPHCGVVGIERTQVFQVPSHGVNQRSVKVSGTRMHHHAGRFVNHHEVGIFIHDVQGNVFGLDGMVVLRRVQHQGDDIQRTNFVVALYGLVVNMHESSIRRLLNAVATGMLQAFKHIFVHPQRLLSFVNHDAEMLIKLLFLIVFQQRHVLCFFGHLFLFWSGFG